MLTENQKDMNSTLFPIIGKDFNTYYKDLGVSLYLILDNYHWYRLRWRSNSRS